MDRNDTYVPGSQSAAESLPAQRHDLALENGQTAALYALSPTEVRSDDPSAPPLLVVHSVNATASAFEMEPLVMRQARRRPVVALDLPGFGASGKPDAYYTPALMQQAIRAAFEWTARHLGRAPIDVVALSLGCEFAAEAVLKCPGRVRTLTLISPTGMQGSRRDEHYEGGATREMTWMRSLLRRTPVGRGLYRVLTTRPLIIWFLARSWGTREFDPRLLEHGTRCAGLPGAERAPLDFIAGALFTRGIIERYRALPVPVWVAHGNRGSFTDFGACPERCGTASTGGDHVVERTVFESGAMPHFELPDAFNQAYEHFLLAQRPTSPGKPVDGVATLEPLVNQRRVEVSNSDR